ncbi:FlgN protein [Posidoniimonas polymericola]|uniref:FlgN protein n=1 Tax=Posidoniimonas polymericola TaxID=2528002 RepID=A0A5C5YR27_9BACT|nr:flagellar export chaperone FlgN [Posidoniimonas polymericola]TWT77210.1 FlgN protein [Posidoniimonas polymericola]
MTTQPHTPERLAELLRQKRQVLTQLHRIGVRQGELVSGGDASLLLKVLGAKQTLLSALQQTEKALAPFRDQDPETRPWPTPGHRAAAAEDAAECARLLDAVVQMEREHEQAMTAQRDRVAQQLRTAHSAHQAAGAYGRQARRHTPAPPVDLGPPSESLDLTSGT